MDVRLPDGTIIRGVPEGTTREQVLAFARSNGVNVVEPKANAASDEQQSTINQAKRLARLATPAGLIGSLVTPEGRQDIANAAAGAVRGSGSIGATLLAPVDYAMDAIKGDRKALGPLSQLVVGPDYKPPVSRNQERRAAMDSALADMGADPDSMMFQGGKIGAEVAGTLGVGGAAANTVARVAPKVAQAVPGLLNAVRTGGMTTGTRAAPGFAPQAMDLGTRVAGGAINGGLAAGLTDPAEAGTGAAISGALPVVTRVAGAAGRVVGNAVSPKMARNNATNKLVGVLGDDASQTIADIQTYLPKGAEDIPVSAAAITKNPKLAQMEQGSRLNSSPQWHEFDVRQSKAAYENVVKATKDADELGKRAAERAENWRETWEAASQAQKPRIWQKRMTEFGANLETALKSPESSNPNVRAVLEAINAEMDRVGPNFSLGHLQQLRANLNGKVNPMAQDAFKSAPRDNPAIISIKQEMDDILNAATGGKWQKVIEGYAKDSEKLHASKAAQKVRNAYVDSATGRVVSPVIDGEIPRVTAANLNNAMNAARLPDKSLALSGDANQRLEATLEALRRQGMAQELKRTATAGGGSDTIPNAIAATAHGATHGAGLAPNLLMQVIGAARKMGAAKTDAEMARLLSNPDELALVLEAWRRPVTPNRLAATLYRSAPAIAAGQ
jgi:hypothetical protein